MPLEGHWQRQNTPLRPIAARERRVLLVVATVLAIAVLGLTAYVLLADTKHRAPAAGCIDVTAASTTGGAQLHTCGSAAVRLCATEGKGASPLALALRPQCRRIGARRSAPTR